MFHSNLSDEKLTRVEVQPVDDATNPVQSELARLGEELENLERKLGVWESCKKHKIALLYVLAAYSCAAAYGYDSIANNATLAMPAFQIYFGSFSQRLNSYYIESMWTSLWSSMTGIGQICGSAIAGPLSQRIGRKHTAMGFSAITIVGVALQYVAVKKEVLLAGKIINGAAVGGLLSVGTTYASEIAPPRLRGILLGGLAFFTIMMQCIGLGIVRSQVSNLRPVAFRSALGLQWLVGGIPIVAFFLVPESPNYLLLKGNVKEARHSIARLYGNDATVDARVAHLQASIQHEQGKNKGKQATYLDCFKGTDRKRTLTVCLLMLGNGLIGSAFLTQNIYFLGLAGLPVAHAFDINIGGFALALLIFPLSWILADKFGRRPLYLVGVAGTAIGMAVAGGLGFTSTRPAIWAVGVLLNILITFQVFTCFMVSWSMAPELSSYTFRQPTQSIGIAVQAFTTWFFAFVTPYMYNVGTDSGNLGAKTGFVFMATSLALLVWAWFWIPETKGLSTEELDELYERKIQPRFFAWEMERIRRGVEELRRDDDDEQQRKDDIELKEFEAGLGERISFGGGVDDFGLR